MGYLYTFDDIRAQRIPTETDYVHLRGVVEAALQEPHFLAASLFGSLPRGDSTLRSDIDVMAVTRQGDHEKARAEILLLAQLAADRHVRLSAHLHTVSEARRGDHPFDSSHRLTMRDLVSAGLAKGLPHQWYQCPGQDIRPDMLQRLCRVLASTSDATHRFSGVRTDLDLDAWIRRSWESGARPLRLYLGFVRWMMWWQHQAPFPDGKKDVLKAFLADEDFEVFHARVVELYDIDREYDDLFQRARQERVNPAIYQDRVHTMIAHSLGTGVEMLSFAIGKLGAVLAESSNTRPMAA